jgi:siroheme synthase (precorrin-2 oxidase/ferrochelatase)
VGGDLAVRTVGPLLACDAEVRVISPHLAPGFSQFRGAPNLTLIGRRLQNGDLEDALLALAVDEDPSVNLATAWSGTCWSAWRTSWR